MRADRFWIARYCDEFERGKRCGALCVKWRSCTCYCGFIQTCVFIRRKANQRASSAYQFPFEAKSKLRPNSPRAWPTYDDQTLWCCNCISGCRWRRKAACLFTEWNSCRLFVKSALVAAPKQKSACCQTKISFKCLPLQSRCCAPARAGRCASIVPWEHRTLKQAQV